MRGATIGGSRARPLPPVALQVRTIRALPPDYHDHHRMPCPASAPVRASGKPARAARLFRQGARSAGPATRRSLRGPPRLPSPRSTGLQRKEGSSWITSKNSRLDHRRNRRRHRSGRRQLEDALAHAITRPKLTVSLRRGPPQPVSWPKSRNVALSCSAGLGDTARIPLPDRPGCRCNARVRVDHPFAHLYEPVTESLRAHALRRHACAFEHQK